jgi:hypothetical protein
MLPYLVLLRMGFTVPLNVTASVVVSYTTVSPLPILLPKPAVYSLLHCPLPWSFGLHLATYNTRPLAGILPCGARTFLPVFAYAAIAWATFPGRIIARLTGLAFQPLVLA